MVEVFTLLVVLLADGGASSFSRDYPTEQGCRFAEAFMRERAKETLGVLDIGTLCVKSELNPDRKPRA